MSGVKLGPFFLTARPGVLARNRRSKVLIRASKVATYLQGAINGGSKCDAIGEQEPTLVLVARHLEGHQRDILRVHVNATNEHWRIGCVPEYDLEQATHLLCTS